MHPDAVLVVTFSPDDRYVLTGGFDNIARLWDIQTGQEVRAITGHTGAVVGVAFSPDGRYILTSSHDQTARLWELNNGREVRRFPCNDLDILNKIAFSPDGKYVFMPGGDITTQLWEVETGQLLGRFNGDHVAFSPDGRYFLTGGQKTARLWDMATKSQLRAFGLTAKLYSVAFMPDGLHVLIGGSDKVARLWDTDYRVLMDSVCARVLRDFTEDERAEYGINDQRPTCPLP
jgi:WD40 repeat protein